MLLTCADDMGQRVPISCLGDSLKAVGFEHKTSTDASATLVMAPFVSLFPPNIFKFTSVAPI